jgi:ATP-dependent DNA helicase RecQ
MLDPKQILIKYWGYTNFRPLQKEIIESVITGNDTLALLPTGGGKSICFQIPSLIQDGICIIITPLISLMHDQVRHLKSKGIKTVSINSEKSLQEIEIALGNCINGNYKFLYISPERLEMKLVQNSINKMNVNLITVDEAHCITEWGYDFRPSYLKISKIRELKPNVPILALTATATEDIIDDIQNKLKFKKNNLLKATFKRDNLSYVIIESKNKKNKLLNILEHFKSSAIVYTKSRKETEAISMFLKDNKISSDYYHAGLEIKIRERKQELWYNGQIRVMVATNAFGMGINKENVRVVIHLNIPYSIESYFQQVGRAGRDGKLAYAILIKQKDEINNLKKFLLNKFPTEDEIRTCYQKIADNFHIAVDTGYGKSFNFEIISFCRRYNLELYKTYNIIKHLENEGLIRLTDYNYSRSKLHLIVDNQELYRFQVSNSYYDSFIKLLLRSYSGLYESYIKIDELKLASKFNCTLEKIIDILKRLHKLNIVDYIPENNSPRIIFTNNRCDSDNIIIPKNRLENKKELIIRKLDLVTKYIKNKETCRSIQLLEYFGEKNNIMCGKCDVCVEKKIINK